MSCAPFPDHKQAITLEVEYLGLELVVLNVGASTAGGGLTCCTTALAAEI